jgi:translocation and assembly module TamB
LRRLFAFLAVVLALLVAAPLIVLAQADQDPEAQKSAFLRFVQDRLSTPDRIIRISNIDGVLSSDASIGEITVADPEGVWLRVNKAEINWNQSALLFGKLEINSLSAESIDILRNAAPPEKSDLPAPEAGGFSVPELPVAVIIKDLSVPKVTFGAEVFGLGSEISVKGNIALEGGSLDSALNIERLDGPGGTLAASAKYQKDTQNLDLAVTLTEPKNGIIANLLNIEGRPDIKLAVAGSGPITDLTTDLTFDAGGQRALAGTALISRVAGGFGIDADLGGPIGTLVAPPYKPFFGDDTHLAAKALLRDGGGISVSGLNLSGGQLTLAGDAETAADGFLSRLNLDVRIADGGAPVVLPVPGAATTIKSGSLEIDYGTDGDNWLASFDLADFTTTALAAETVRFTAGGIAANLSDPAARRLTFNGDGNISGIKANDAAVGAALGDAVGFGVAGLWNAGQPVQLAQLRLEGKAVSLALKGAIDNWVYDGDVLVNAADISPFSGLAGRELSGGLDLAANGTISPLLGGFNLTLDGTGSNLGIDDATADRLLAGDVRLTGRLARTETGIEAENFRLGNQQVQLAANGDFASDAADFRFDLGLADLGLLTPQASGRLGATGTAKGSDGNIALAFDANVPDGALAGRTLRTGTVGFDGTLNAGTLAGKLSGSAFLDGHRVDLGADLALNDAGRRLDNLAFTAGGTRLTGNLAQDASGLTTGSLDLDANDISTAAALLLAKASGAVKAAITLAPVNGEQNASISGTVRNLTYDTTKIGSADITAELADLFGVPQVDGHLTGTAISAAGIDIASLDATANRAGDTTNFDAKADLTNGTALAVTGALSPLDTGYRLALQKAELTQGALAARLAEPAALTVAGNSVTMDAIRFDVGSGSITATGTAGEALDIALVVKALPLSIANAVAPDLKLAGTLDGTASIKGSASAPEADFQLAARGVNAAAIQPFGIAPVSASASGRFANNRVSLASLQADGAGGLAIAGSGAVPLSGPGLDVKLTGSAPLALANRFVADRGGQLSGNLALDAAVTGSLDSPKFAGRVSTSGAGYIDPELHLRLVGITGAANLSGDRISIDTLSANLATGGSVAVSGSVGLAGNFPADLAIRLNSARYADGNLLVATVSGGLQLSGQLTRDPVLSGNIAVEKADISVPERIGGGAALVDVQHRATPAPVARTLQRAEIDKAAPPTPQTRPSILRLDVNVSAPNQIFLRGRGLDAELGGSVRLTGPVTDIQPVGGFSLNRGRLSILGQRITFESGEVTLVGDLDPYVNLVARTEGDDITVFVTVSGRVSDIDVTFTSNPTLPQDEVLSHLIFNRPMSELSPLQLAKLAGAAAELAGGGGSSLVDSLREATGLDDLDVVTDSSGNVAVQAGRYIQDNVYLGVTAGANGESKVNVDLDITSDLKARGSMGSDGNSSVGVFYEKDF